MSDGIRILRTIGIPAAIAVLVLLVTPRMCARAIPAERSGNGTAAPSDRVSPSEAPSSPADALHISTTSPEVVPPRSTAYPSGLDAERIEYFIEIDPTFSAPFAMRVPKSGTKMPDGAETIFLSALRQSGLFQLVDGSYAPTRDAALHLDGLTEDAAGWVVPVGKRAFDRIVAFEGLGDGRHRATFRWAWVPNMVGASLLSKPAMHEAAAEFSGGERHWALTQMTGLDQPFE